MNSRDKFEKLYKLLNGYNRSEYEREIIFDFYNKVGTVECLWYGFILTHKQSLIAFMAQKVNMCAGIGEL